MAPVHANLRFAFASAFIDGCYLEISESIGNNLQMGS
jgi:hypothetical protein